jgi:hypothetical protein
MSADRRPIVRLTASFQNRNAAIAGLTAAIARIAVILENRKPIVNDPACDRFLAKLYSKPRNRLRAFWRPPM